MEKPKETRSRYVYMDLARVVSCILVVCVHIAAMDFNNYPIQSMEWKLLNAMDSLGLMGVPLFFMLSGALFLNSDRQLSVAYVWKKIGMVFLAYLLTLFVYNIFPFVRGWAPWEPRIVKVDLLDNVLLGRGCYHLWFLPVLMTLYMLSPLLKEVFATKKNCEYFLALYVMAGIVLPFVLQFETGLSPYLKSVENRFMPAMVSGYIGYFVWGHYLHTYMEKRKKTQVIGLSIGLMLVMVLIWSCNDLLSVKKGYPVTIASEAFGPLCFVFVTGFYLLFKNLEEYLHSAKLQKILSTLASLTMGIYLVHPLIITHLLLELPIKEWIGCYPMVLMVRLIVVLVLSGAIVAVLKRIPGLKKIL